MVHLFPGILRLDNKITTTGGGGGGGKVQVVYLVVYIGNWLTSFTVHVKTLFHAFFFL